MFQSSDDLNIDEEFLKDVFDIPTTNNESNKRNSDPLPITDQHVKKICTQSPDNTKNILSMIKSKSVLQKPSEIVPSNLFSKSSKNYCANNNSLINKSIPNNAEICRRVVQRKFPGPAGILPEQKPSINIKTVEEFDTSVNNETLESNEIVCSQLTENIFKNSPWEHMLKDWSAVYNHISLPNKYTISWIKSKALAKKLIGQKTPFLAAVIQTVDHSSKDPMILLKDKTGDIQATLLHEVWEEYNEYLTPGSVLVLKQVGVLSTLKKHYLAITLNNIVSIYSEHENEETDKTLQKIIIQELTVNEFIKMIENTKQKHQTQKVLQKVQPNINNQCFKKPHNTYLNANKNNLNKENHTTSTSSENVLSNKTTEDEHIILTQMLDGLDTDVLFEDF